MHAFTYIFQNGKKFKLAFFNSIFNKKIEKKTNKQTFCNIYHNK